MGTDRSQAARAAFFARRNAAPAALLIGNAVDLELDGNGRFLIPPRLREYAKLDKRAMLVGQLNKFQLWDEMPGTPWLKPTWRQSNNPVGCRTNYAI